MPKIVKNGKEYSGVPIEVVTAWAPTADPVQVKEPLMGNTDISTIGDGTVTGAIDALNTGLTNLIKYRTVSGTTAANGSLNLGMTATVYDVISVVSLDSNANNIVLPVRAGTANFVYVKNAITMSAVASTAVSLGVYYRDA